MTEEVIGDSYGFILGHCVVFFEKFDHFTFKVSVRNTPILYSLYLIHCMCVRYCRCTLWPCLASICHRQLAYYGHWFCTRSFFSPPNEANRLSIAVCPEKRNKKWKNSQKFPVSLFDLFCSSLLWILNYILNFEFIQASTALLTQDLLNFCFV